MKHLFKFLFFKPRDVRLVLTTFMLLSLVRLGLWLLPFSVLQQLLGKLPQKTSFALKKNQVTVDRIIWAVNVSSKYMPGQVKCLARALTTEVLMNLGGYDPKLQIGVAQSKTGKLEAHAWIESQGQVIMGQLQDLARFQALPLPSREFGRQ